MPDIAAAPASVWPRQRRETRHFFLALACVLAAVILPQAHAQSPQKTIPGRYALNTIKKGRPYAVVRGDMLAIGNLPDYHDAASDSCVPNVSMCKVYPETDACSGTGLGFCRFGWTAKEGGHYFIITTGEFASGLPVNSVIKE